MAKALVFRGFLLLLALLLALAVLSPMIGQATREMLSSQDVQDIPLNEHALEAHGDIAKQAQETVQKCSPDKFKEYRGLGKYEGMTLLSCAIETSTKIAIWVLAQNADGTFRTITAFISKNNDYICNLVNQMKYVPVR